MVIDASSVRGFMGILPGFSNSKRSVFCGRNVFIDQLEYTRVKLPKPDNKLPKDANFKMFVAVQPEK